MPVLTIGEALQWRVVFAETALVPWAVTKIGAEAPASRAERQHVRSYFACHQRVHLASANVRVKRLAILAAGGGRCPARGWRQEPSLPSVV